MMMRPRDWFQEGKVQWRVNRDLRALVWVIVFALLVLIAIEDRRPVASALGGMVFGATVVFLIARARVRVLSSRITRLRERYPDEDEE
jgi:hypothetical protein